MCPLILWTFCLQKEIEPPLPYSFVVTLIFPPCERTNEPLNLMTNLVFIEYIEDKGGKLGGISEGKELLVYLLEAHSIQLPTRTVFNEAFVPEKQSRHREDYSVKTPFTL